MSTFLFDQTIFGPINSRRLGISLGINLLPNDSKLCSFDCIYCECGWNPEKGTVKAILPTRTVVKNMLGAKLSEMKSAGEVPDVITFAGNGEPTMHPDFAAIIDDTLLLRDELCPGARIAVLSNSTMLHKPKVVEALKKIDDNILKLDSGLIETIKILDQPVGRFDLQKVVSNIKQFDGQLIIQTMFIRGNFKGEAIDNTTEKELKAWIEILLQIRPRLVMIYTIARDTPANDLQKVSTDEMETIAVRVRNETGLEVQVSG
ncbi:MAG TPA: radical SAM protein [Prolixibacteraceae bacterium]|jgi:wyosine [tRNA(Phe)-imidazoG37] synthetase (radical SAM superfamily)